MAPSKLLDGFVLWSTQDRSQSSQLSDRTAKRYRRYAELFFEQYGHPAQVKESHFVAWRSTLTDDSATTINVKLSALRAFFEYLIARGVRKDDPSRILTMKRVASREPKFLSRRTMDKLFSEVYAQSDLQDRAILEVLYGSGVRREEAGSMVLGDIVDRDRLRVIGKGNKERDTIITEPEYRAVRDLLLARTTDQRVKEIQLEISDDAAFEVLRKHAPETPIFCARDNRAFKTYDDPGYPLWKRIVHYSKLIEEPLTPHQFRHSFATHLLSEGVDIYKVSKMLGHTDIKTTTIYLGLEDKVFQEVSAAHPRTHSIPGWAKAA